MSSTPNGIPELAGIATYDQAAKIGYSVTENVDRMLRFHWAERRLMDFLVAHITATPEWEVKCAMCLHQWYAAEHADQLRTRITEMRHPAPPLDRAPNAALDAFFEELLRCNGTLELLTGCYQVALPALRDGYQRHIDRTNPLIDHPTRRMMRFFVADLDEAIAWGDRALAAYGAQGDEWLNHLQLYLAGAGGIAGDELRLDAELPPSRATAPFVPSFDPQRDERFGGMYNFEFPPHVVYNAPEVPADERNLALLCKRTLEMDVPEMMASFIYERDKQPWSFYVDYSRQLWDEARHAMLGSVGLKARGVDWMKIPLNVGFSLRLNHHATPLERQIMLYAIEQSLMPGETGKRFEYQTAVDAGDELSAHFHDYDWADEVLHAQIGRRTLAREGISQADALERAKQIHEKTWAALDQYKDLDEQRDWWPAFVREALGKETAATPEKLGELNIFSE